MYRRIALAALLVAGHVDSSRAAADPARCRELIRKYETDKAQLSAKAPMPAASRHKPGESWAALSETVMRIASRPSRESFKPRVTDTDGGSLGALWFEAEEQRTDEWVESVEHGRRNSSMD